MTLIVITLLCLGGISIWAADSSHAANHAAGACYQVKQNLLQACVVVSLLASQKPSCCLVAPNITQRSRVHSLKSCNFFLCHPPASGCNPGTMAMTLEQAWRFVGHGGAKALALNAGRLQTKSDDTSQNDMIHDWLWGLGWIHLQKLLSNYAS